MKKLISTLLAVVLFGAFSSVFAGGPVAPVDCEIVEDSDQCADDECCFEEGT